MRIFVVVSVASFLCFCTLAAQSSLDSSLPEVVRLADRPAPVRTLVSAHPPQTKPAELKYNFKNFSEDDASSVTLTSASCFLADRLGRVWIGAYGYGLSLYNGRDFRHFGPSEGLPDISINALFEAKDGNIWIGLLGKGVSFYDGSEFTTLTTKDGLINDNVHSILQDKKGRMWLGTEAGVSLYDQHSFQNFGTKEGVPSGTITTIAEDSAGNIWFGSDTDGLGFYDGNRFKVYKTTDGLTDNRVRASLVDRQGRLWFGTDNGVTLFEHGRMRAYENNSSLPGKVITALFEDSLGRLWFGTQNGAAFWDGKRFLWLGKEQGLAANDVNAIGEDKSGGIWVSTNSGGPSRFDGGSISWISASPDFTGTTKAIAQDRSGALWIAHMNDGGLQHFDGRSLTTYTTKQGLPSNTVRSLFIDRDNNLWVATLGGVSRFDGKAFTSYTSAQGLVDNRVFDLLQDKEGHMWFATLGGVSRFDGHSFTNYRAAQGLQDDKSNCLFEDSQGRIWVFHWYSRGISRFDGQRFAQVRDISAANMAFEDSAGNIWFATIDRLIRFDGSSSLDYTIKDGLVDEFIQSVISIKRKDREPELLIGSHGISILEGFRNKDDVGDTLPAQNKVKNDVLKSSYTPIFKNLDISSGDLIKDVAGIRAVIQDRQGIIWIGTSYLKAQFVRLDLEAAKTVTSQPVTHIDSIRIDNKKLDWRALPKDYRDLQFAGLERYFPVPKQLVLPYHHNGIAFSFLSIDTTRPNNLLYQYQLEGLTKEWVPPTKNTYAAFDGLYEGTYQFKVKARNPDGVWGEPTTYTFSILPPWYRTWWAYSAYGISTLVVLFGIYYWRTAALRRRHKLLRILYEAAERFVPRTFLSLLGKHNIQDVQLGDSIETNLTVLFSDIRNYTSLAERLKPGESYAFINSYWAVTAPIIDEHKGFISQYLGDGVMALFPQHPDDAVEAVLDMMDALDSFNAKQAQVGGHQIMVGYALSTGPATLGTIGVNKRMDANVISNTSNLASRVENLNKFYGTRFLVSDPTFKSLSDPDQYTVRFVDKIRAKGMHHTVKLWEIYRRGPISDTERTFIDTYQQAFEKYDLGDFQGALAGFQQARDIKPDDLSCAILIDRCETLIKEGTPKGWDGVFEMQHK